ncbi:hypothetical protein [Pseudonocardia sp. NPDC049635]|uniref:hypothetical protein n=1 Tax=Pseudonocardia sp. NPDC049635 TaxID=3155506 RepID=UPI0033CCD7F6
MTGPQQPRPHPDDGTAGARPSPQPRHGRSEHDFPQDSYQGEQHPGGYPDLRAARPVERPAPAVDGHDDLYGDRAAEPHRSTDPGGHGDQGRHGRPAQRGQVDLDQRGYGGEVPEPGPVGGQPAYPVPSTGAGARRPVPDTGLRHETGPRPGYGEYGDPASRGGTAIDGGPPYAGAPPAPAARHVPADDRDGAPRDSAAAAGSGTAVAERDDPDPATGPAVAVPAQRAAAPGNRPATVAEAAAARFGNPAGAPATASAPGSGSVPAPAPASAAAARKEPAALTALRVITYVLVSLSCLIFLAGAVYGFLAWLELRDALSTSPLFGGAGG